jgi:glycerophosphoryl diester phosphodiesterase
MQILTHRGLDSGKKEYFAESSCEAFLDQLGRGFGLEFDLQFTKEGEIIISHDFTLDRISGGKITGPIKNFSRSEILSFDFNNCHLTDLETLLGAIGKTDPRPICAVHIKSGSQEQKYLKVLFEKIKGIDPEKFILFDLKPRAAEYLKSLNQALNLAPSVAHPYDIKRYNKAVGGTLMSVNDAVSYRNLYSWVWLDEWDLSDEGGKKKTFYNAEVFETLRGQGFKISLVTPELHGSSPGLLGGEAHPDAKNKEILTKRFKEILALKPDALCTDYPDLVRDLNNNLK